MNSECFIARTRFCEYMVEYNGLNERGFKKWAFYPGMLFKSTNKWWGNGGSRDTPHEGLDFGLFIDEYGNIHCLDKKIKVPVIYGGKVIRIIDDFIGQSIYVSHDIYDGKGNQLYTIYSHAEPCNGVGWGEIVSEGNIIATITDVEKKKVKMSSHLHLSIAWIHKSFPYERLNWKTINDPVLVTLLDPLKIISCKYTVLRRR